MPISKAGHYVGAKGQRGPPGPPGEGFVKTAEGDFDLGNRRLVNLQSPHPVQKLFVSNTPAHWENEYAATNVKFLNDVLLQEVFKPSLQPTDPKNLISLSYLNERIKNEIIPCLPEEIKLSPADTESVLTFKRKRIVGVETSIEAPQENEAVNLGYLNKRLRQLLSDETVTPTVLKQNTVNRSDVKENFSAQGSSIVNLKTGGVKDLSEAANTGFVENKLQKLRDVSVLLFEDGTENTTTTQYITNKIKKEIESLKENIKEQVNTALKPTLEKLQRIKEDILVELEVQIIKDIMFAVKRQKGETLNEGEELPNLTESLQEFIEMTVSRLPH